MPTNFSGGAGGSHPGGMLLVDANGNLFGTTLSGGANNAGTVFEIQKTGETYATSPTILTSFNSGIVPFGYNNQTLRSVQNESSISYFWCLCTSIISKLIPSK